jgi:hypothetical protein
MPLLKMYFVKTCAVDIPLSLILNAYSTPCNNPIPPSHAAQAVLVQHTTPLRLTEIDGQGINL